MKHMKTLARTAAVAIGLSTLAPLAMTASAGEWRINARECPDLREDARDYRRDTGWRDRAEDRRDARVIKCPARAWYYVRYRGERGAQPPRPRQIMIDRFGHEYYRDYRGRMIALEVDYNWGRRG
jgi:hypothetical protein